MKFGDAKGMQRQRAKRLITLAALGAIAGVIGFLTLTMPPAEPRYHGRPLRYWLMRTQAARLSAVEQSETRAALECIGTNNLPLLLEWLKQEEPEYVEPLRQRVLNWVLAKQHFFKARRFQYRLSRPEMAFQMFNQVPSVSRAAMPEFIKMLSDPDEGVAGKAWLFLGKIGWDAIPALVPVLSSTNQTARGLAAAALGDIGAEAKPVAPILESMLADSHRSVRVEAAEALGKIGGNAETFVPVLVQCYHEGDSEMRFYVLDVLVKLRESAQPAVPELLNWLATATNQAERGSIFGALNAIDPQAAQKVKASLIQGSQ